MFKLPDNSIVNGEGYTTIGEYAHPLSRMSPTELSAIGVSVYEPEPEPYFNPYFYSSYGISRSMKQIKDFLKDRVKSDANRKILNISPEYKQRNMLARSIEILFDNPDKGIGQLSPELEAEAKAMQAIWDDVKSIRNQSNTIEASIDKLTTAAEAEAFVPDWGVWADPPEGPLFK